MARGLTWPGLVEKILETWQRHGKEMERHGKDMAKSVNKNGKTLV